MSEVIFDHISNLGIYAKGDKKLEVVADFLKKYPMESLADGRHELGMGIYVNVGSNVVFGEGKFEVHRRYADIQLVIDGSERMEWEHLDDLQNATEYSEAKDIQFFAQCIVAPIELNVYKGNFALFYPQDGHKPGLRLNHDSCRKAVFKIPLDE